MNWRAEIRARLRAASSGPWRTHFLGAQWDTPTIEKVSGGILAQTTHYWPMHADAELMAHAPSDLARCLEALEIATEALQRYEDATPFELISERRRFSREALASIEKLGDATVAPLRESDTR